MVITVSVNYFYKVIATNLVLNTVNITAIIFVYILLIDSEIVTQLQQLLGFREILYIIITFFSSLDKNFFIKAFCFIVTN